MVLLWQCMMMIMMKLWWEAPHGVINFYTNSLLSPHSATIRAFFTQDNKDAKAMPLLPQLVLGTTSSAKKGREEGGNHTLHHFSSRM